MKIIRAISIAFALLVPAVALAGDPAPTCCPDGDCCPTCPFCGAHHK